MSIPELIELLIKIINKDEEAMSSLLRMLYPLFRDIPGAMEAMMIARLCLKNLKSHVLSEIPTMLKIMMISIFAEVKENKEGVMRKFQSVWNMDDYLIQALSDWIHLAVVLLSKDSTQKNLDNYISAISNACTSLSYVMGRHTGMITDVKNLEAVIKTVLGLCKGDFSLIAEVASQQGYFEHQKVKDIFNVFAKFQNTIFGGEVYGMPEMANGLKTSFFSLQKNFDNPEVLARGAVKLIKDQGSEALGKVTSHAKKEVKKVAEDAMQSAGSAITELLYKDLFKMFDKDESGSITFSEFQDLCKYMGLYLNREKGLRMFSMADTSGNNLIEVWEFQNAMILIKLQIARETLTKLGITTEDLVWFGVLTLIYLILALVFIFLGIFAFSKAEGFNAVVNSIFPLIAGIVAGTRSIDIKQKLDQVKDYIKSLISEISKKF
jgi:hypothetical protein